MQTHDKTSPAPAIFRADCHHGNVRSIACEVWKGLPSKALWYKYKEPSTIRRSIHSRPLSRSHFTYSITRYDKYLLSISDMESCVDAGDSLHSARGVTYMYSHLYIVRAH